MQCFKTRQRKRKKRESYRPAADTYHFIARPGFIFLREGGAPDDLFVSFPSQEQRAELFFHNNCQGLKFVFSTAS